MGQLGGGIQNMRLQLESIFAKYYFRNSCIHLEFEHFKCFEVSINYIMIKVAEGCHYG
jgi:hypothetical protein